MYKKWIRLGEDGKIMRASTDAFFEPEDGNICVGETMDRQWGLGKLFDLNSGVALYLYRDGEIVERGQVNIDMEAFPILDERRIRNRLAELDVVIPRALEDLYGATGKIPYPSVKNVIEEKASLRLELRQYFK